MSPGDETPSSCPLRTIFLLSSGKARIGDKTARALAPYLLNKYRVEPNIPVWLNTANETVEQALDDIFKPISSEESERKTSASHSPSTQLSIARYDASNNVELVARLAEALFNTREEWSDFLQIVVELHPDAVDNSLLPGNSEASQGSEHQSDAEDDNPSGDR